MKIELVIPLLCGIVLALVGAALIFDAWTPDELVVSRERRRAPRAERDRPGETMLGFGMIAVAATFFGRDVWAYRIIAVGVGAILLVIGAVRNRHFLHDLVANRGKLRRGAPPDVLARTEPGANAAETPESSERRLRIR